jgi:hypothetical protein
MLTTGIFLAVIFGTWTLILGLLIPFCLLPLRKDVAIIRDSVKPLKQVGEEIDRLGLQEFIKSLGKEEKHHSLSLEKAQRKQELLSKGQAYGLDANEAEELKGLLNEEASSDFASGLIGAIAVIGAIALIAVFVNSLTKKKP